MHVIPDTTIREYISLGIIDADDDIPSENVQPASLDLRLGNVAYAIKHGFLPGNTTVESRLNNESSLDNDMVVDTLSLSQGETLTPGQTYLIPLKEQIRFSGTGSNLGGYANPKSSSARLDMFVRLVTDYANSFDRVLPQYVGPLYIEVVTNSFQVCVREDDTLNQLRFAVDAVPLAQTEYLTVNLEAKDTIFRAIREGQKIDLADRGMDRTTYWEPVPSVDKRVVVHPGEFYLLQSAERVAINPDTCAELISFNPSIGEFRTHYAGFFDPGFGYPRGLPAVLEMRVFGGAPFELQHRQRVAQLKRYSMLSLPDKQYGDGNSHYSDSHQHKMVSKQFRDA